ncbi:hypothetical protein BN2476_250089 [Paraburkholderia piptadeniae]|uniref:Uncharacterized protein n=1 Tax=Paraburkholderia piptadeniae TaxID=1701573 RepID=A0A1N7S0A6_9BURK|nr:hypothetical protein BN2476_250089 [Paraburkholderia piptadeniae]
MWVIVRVTRLGATNTERESQPGEWTEARRVGEPDSPALAITATRMRIISIPTFTSATMRARP